jgi:hypothetical protein
MSNLDSEDDKLSLFSACQHGRVRRVLKLLQDGADIEEKNPTQIFGFVTPLQIAVSYAELRITELLINNGADMFVLYDNGESLLIRAARMHGSNVNEMLELLLRKGADMGYTQINNTPPPRLSGGGAIENMMPPGSNDWNALHVAAYAGNCGFVEILIKHGADILTRTNRGETALDLALMSDYPEPEFPEHRRHLTEEYITDILDRRANAEKNRHFLLRLSELAETVRLLQVAERQLAFAMGHHPRLGERSSLTKFSPDELRMILELSNIDRVRLDPRIE